MKVKDINNYNSEKFTTRFDANSYLYLLRAMDNYDLSSADSSSFGTGSEDSPKTRTFFHVPLYHSINKLYYKDIDNIRGYVDYFRGVPTSSDAIFNYTSTRNLYDTNLPLRRPHTRQLKNNAVLITIPQKFYGEHIKPTSLCELLTWCPNEFLFLYVFPH